MGSQTQVGRGNLNALLLQLGPTLGCALDQDNREEPDVAGKKRLKSLAQTEKKPPAKPKRPRKTSRGK